MMKGLATVLVSVSFLMSVGCANQPAPGPTASNPPPRNPPAATGSPAASSTPVAMTGSGTPAAEVPMDTLTHPTTGIQFSVPKDWSRKKLDDDSLEVAKGEEVVLVYKVVPRSQMNEFSKKLDAEIGKHLTDQKADESSAKTEELKPLTVSSQSGTGKLKGKPVEWQVWAIGGPSSDKLMFMIGFGDLKANEATLTAMRKSFVQGKPTAGK